MKTIRIKIFAVAVAVVFILVAASTIPLYAQTAATSSQSAGDLQVMIQAVEQTQPLPATEVDGCIGYSAQHSPVSENPWPPLPNVLGLPVWPLGSNTFLIDDLDVDYAALAAAAEAQAAASPMKDEHDGQQPCQQLRLRQCRLSYQLTAGIAGDRSITANFSIAAAQILCLTIF